MVFKSLDKIRKILFKALEKDPVVYVVICQKVVEGARMLWTEVQEDEQILRVFISKEAAQSYVDFLIEYAASELDDDFFERHSFKLAAVRVSTLISALNQTYPLHGVQNWNDRLSCVICAENIDGELQEVDILWQQMPN